QGLHLAGPR
ncbi:hypothetical protein BN1708_018233, partial [Verticillium longisporum]